MGFLPKLYKPSTVKKKTLGFLGLNLTGDVAENQLLDCDNILTEDMPSLKVRGQMIRVADDKTTSENYVMRAVNLGDSVCAMFTDFENAFVCNEYKFGDTLETYNFDARVAKYIKEDFTIVNYKGNLFIPYYNSETSQVCMMIMKRDPLTMASVVIAKNVTKQVDHIHLIPFRNRLLCAYDESIWICYEDNYMLWDKFYVDGSDGSSEINEAVCQQIPLATGGHFTACAYFKDKPIIFKEREMYALYGNYTPFSIVKIADIGCVSQQSIQVIGDEMIFLSQHGLMVYSGGTPYCISQLIPNLQHEQIMGCCSTNRYYFINEYVYDISKKCFSKLEDEYIPFCSHKDKVYFYSYKQRGYYEMSDEIISDGENVEWSFLTKQLYESTADEKVYSKLKIRVEALEQASFKVECSFDGGEFEGKVDESIMTSKGKTVSINIPPCHSLQLRVRGTGRVKIPLIEREYRTINGV